MLRQLAKIGLAVVVFALALGSTAEAQYGIGAGVYSRGIPNYGFNGYRNNNYNYIQPRTTYYGPGYRYNSFYRPGPVWHDTTHYDYHPGGFVPHGNHYHYIPGHYDLHRSGHWHW
jgi:hypothetical protein